MQQVTLGISGMSCGGCVRNVQSALEAVPGIHVDTVTVGSATVSYDASPSTSAAITQAVRAAGYDVIEAGEPVPAGKGGGCGCGCG